MVVIIVWVIVLGIHKVLLADGRLVICSSFIYGGLGVWLFIVGMSLICFHFFDRSFFSEVG
jgi:hypothetical protein